MEHYYSEKQTSPLRIKEIEVVLRGASVKLRTGSGVFSIGRIDRGSQILIEYCVITGGKILDLGCGYGAVGIALAKAYPSAAVLMTDINERAVKLARMNIKLNNLSNCSVKKSDLYKNIEDEFDTIVTNPPQLAGKEVCFQFIEGARDHLVKGGLLQLVARHNKGGKQLEAKMKETFGNVRHIAKKGGYRVYVSEKS